MVMRLRNCLWLLLLIAFSSIAQEFKSDGDKLFYSYAFQDAINAYQKQLEKGEVLTNHQFLNLADSYFKIKDYQSATDIYLDINKKDSIMSDNRFNNMLQSLAKTSEPERVKAFLKSKRGSFNSEFFENANFNYEILDDDSGDKNEFDIFNLNTNSPQADISPTFYKERLLFSTSRKSKSKKIYGPSGESYLSIYIARIGQEGILLNQNSYNRIPKAEFHKSTPYFSESLNSVFYVLSNTDEDGDLVFNENGKNALAIGLVDVNGNFRYVLKDLSNSFYYPFYHNQSSRLYFAADFGTGYGGTDLYYVSMNGGQVMSQPINLGPRINTPGNEIAPFIYENSLYFSSDAFYGLGGMDIYKANIQSNQNFGIPVNLGKGINSISDDFGFILRPDTQSEGFLGYFASNRKGGVGNDDIYGFRIKITPGLRTLVFQGKVVEKKTTYGIPDATVKVLDSERNVLKEIGTKKDGSFRIELPWREQVSLKVEKAKHSIYFKNFNGESSQTGEMGDMNIQMTLVSDIIEKKENKTVLTVENLVFEGGNSELTFSIKDKLNKVTEIVRQFPQIKFRIETHTSSKGRNDTNKRISQERADAMLAYLKQQGVANENVSSAIGYGEEQVVNNCKNGVYCLDFLHAQNERTLFVVLNEEDINQ